MVHCDLEVMPITYFFVMTRGSLQTLIMQRCILYKVESAHTGSNANYGAMLPAALIYVLTHSLYNWGYSIVSYIANISLYAINRPKLTFGGYLTFESTFQALKQDKANNLMKIESFDRYFCLLFTSACGKFWPYIYHFTYHMGKRDSCAFYLNKLQVLIVTNSVLLSFCLLFTSACRNFRPQLF